jgi:hypothetical protein
MPSDPDRRRVVPQTGDDSKNGEDGAPANRAQVPAHGAGRRASPCVTKDGQPLGAGGQAALPPHLGRPPTLPRPGDPGPAGNPVRAILGRLSPRTSPVEPGTTVVRGSVAVRDPPRDEVASDPDAADLSVAFRQCAAPARPRPRNCAMNSSSVCPRSVSMRPLGPAAVVTRVRMQNLIPGLGGRLLILRLARRWWATRLD